MAVSASTKRVIYAALAGNLLIALTKAAAALWTGSSAMLSEAVHSLVDTGNQGLLLYGQHRSSLQADREHPIGYGRELYFWSFIVALLVFGLGAVVSVFLGISHLRDPEPIDDPFVNYLVLGLAFVFESASWWIALQHFKRVKGALGYYAAFRASKDPTSFIVLFEDSAALIGIVIAAVGTFAATRLDMPALDGIASILIGVVLAATAGFLARESKSLLIGERADRALSDSLLRIAEGASATSSANGVITVQLAPDQILAALSLEFDDTLRVPEIEAAVIEIERLIRAAHPEVVRLFIKPQSRATFKAAVRDSVNEAPIDGNVVVAP